jgi:hypothetical protein
VLHSETSPPTHTLGGLAFKVSFKFVYNLGLASSPLLYCGHSPGFCPSSSLVNSCVQTVACAMPLVRMPLQCHLTLLSLCLCPALTLAAETTHPSGLLLMACGSCLLSLCLSGVQRRACHLPTPWARGVLTSLPAGPQSLACAHSPAQGRG